MKPLTEIIKDFNKDIKNRFDTQDNSQIYLKAILEVLLNIHEMMEKDHANK